MVFSSGMMSVHLASKNFPCTQPETRLQMKLPWQGTVMAHPMADLTTPACVLNPEAVAAG